MKKRKKTAFMYGFRKDDVDETGYLKVLEGGGYSVVKDRADATGFETENESGRKGWGDPDRWCEFFNGEDELKEWKFHAVRFFKDRKDGNDEEEDFRD